MIPDLDPATGHLPVGRYLASIDEVHDRFVAHPEFDGSVERSDLWDGFLLWLTAWSEIDERLGTSRLLNGLWMAGSFVSREQHPEDIDVTAFVDDSQLKAAAAASRATRLLRKVAGHREKIRDTFGIEVFTVPWHATERPLSPSRQSQDEQAYLSRRGAYDDFWQRLRPPGPKAPPRAEDAPAARGYLEVIT